MKRSRDLMLVGAFVLMAGTLLVGSLLWLAGARVFRAVDRYQVVFDRSVSGLAPGAAVEFQGVMIGRVQDIRLTEELPPRVTVFIEVEPGTPVRNDTTAALLGSIVTGIKFIALQGGTEAAGRLEDGGTIDGSVTSFEELGDQATLIGRRVLSILENLDDNVFTTENNAKLSEFITDVAILTDTLRTTIEPFREARTGEKLATAVDHVGAAATTVDRLFAELHDAQVISDVDSSLESLRAAASDTREFVRAMRQELSGTGSALATLLTDLASATERLEETLALIQTDPSLLLRGRVTEGDSE